jgi:hypothetical protein
MFDSWQVYDFTALLMLLILSAMGVGLIGVWFVDVGKIILKRIKNGRNN